MSDDLDALKAAVKAAPPADPQAKEAALRLAMQNFDQIQGSRDAVRLSPDRPMGAAGAKGVWRMFADRMSRPWMAGGSVAALVAVALVGVPLMQRGTLPGLGKVAERAPVVAGPAEPKAQDSAAPKAEAPAPTETEAVTMAAPEPAPAPAAPAQESRLADAPLAEADEALAQGQAATAADGLAKAAPTLTLAAPEPQTMPAPEPVTDAYANAAPNPVHVTAEDPVSTFSADVDTASWSVVRSWLNGGQLPPAEAVRVEEMVNYFPYDYAAPEGDAPFAADIAVMPTPWNPGTELVRIGLQGRGVTVRPPLNLVFLVDTSGSMEDANKLPLLKQSLRLMLPRLSDQDRIAIVAYAGSAGEVLPPTPASDRAAIEAALERLSSGGSTAGAEGIALAYQVAEGMARDGAVSRVLLATDGDFNVGVSDPAALEAMIAQKRQSGVYLSVLGFGRGNLDDATMQALAQNGNGTASYIDTLGEAQKVLGDQLTGALFPIADDVKLQVEWNPARVAEYRLIGYETRALRREDFSNDRVDAGEVGAGLQVTALYEVTAPGSPALRNDPLRYGPKAAAGDASELGFLRLRWKAPGAAVSQLAETPITGAEGADDEARFAAAVAGFGQLLAGSDDLGTWTWTDAIALAQGAKGADPYGYRAEAVQLMRLAESLAR